MININMQTINNKTIFHELNHAAQFLLRMNNGATYSGPLMEVETRMILFYSPFLKADEATRKDSKKMRDFIIDFYGEPLSRDLQPLTGNFYGTQNSWYIAFPKNMTKGLSEQEIYSVIYKGFSSLKNGDVNSNDFDYLMLRYAEWIKVMEKYHWDFNQFKPNYYLLKKLN